MMVKGSGLVELGDLGRERGERRERERREAY